MYIKWQALAFVISRSEVRLLSTAPIKQRLRETQSNLFYFDCVKFVTFSTPSKCAAPRCLGLFFVLFGTALEVPHYQFAAIFAALCSELFKFSEQFHALSFRAIRTRSNSLLVTLLRRSIWLI